MSNHKKRYNKFVAGVASTALVASAIAPITASAAFSDTKDNTHEKAINALVSEGIINGYEDGTFRPNKTLTRSDVVKMMGKWLVSLGYEVPSDYKTKPRFKDHTTNTNDELLRYSALVADTKVFRGYEDGTLGAGNDITRENMAIVLVRAYDTINKTDLISYVKQQTFDRDVTDLNTAKQEARPAIDVLDYFDITNPAAPQFNPKNTTTRGQFASFLYKTANLENPEAPLEVKEVTASDITVDSNKEGQFLPFTVNGDKKVTVKELTDAGYEVEFRSTVEAVIKDAKTGELDKEELKHGQTFQYQVLIRKGEDVLQSNPATVQVLDFTKSIASLDSYTLTQGDTELSSKTLVLGSNGTISAVKGKTHSGTDITLPAERLTFTSSDTSKVLVNSSGTLTPVAPGQATVTITVQDTNVKLDIPITIARDARVATNVKADVNQIGVVTNGTRTVTLTVTDQYGDPIAGFQADAATVKSGDTTIAYATSTESDAAGSMKVTITATDQTGTGNLEVTANGKTYVTIPVTVGSGAVVGSRKLELQQSSSDRTIDLNPLQNDRSVTFVYNEYSSDNLLIGPSTDIGTSGKTYRVSASNDNVTVSVDDNGVITVTGQKEGSSNIVVREGSIVRDTVTVTVQDTSPTISNVSFTERASITSAGATPVSEFITASGIQISSSDDVKIDGRGNIYIDVEGTAANEYNEGQDVLLGTIDAVSPTFSVSIANGNIQLNGADPADGQNGEFSLRVRDAKGNVISARTVKVNIPPAVTP